MTTPQLTNEAYIGRRGAIHLRPATDEDAHLPQLDHTALSNINMCPTWGIVRYGLHKSMGGTGRAMALEAGGAAHEAYAAIRLFDLRERQKLDEHFHSHGPRIFGRDRFQQMLPHADSSEDERTRRLNFALEALYTCGFYDDPGDKRRTVSNIEEALIAYTDQYEAPNGPSKFPIYVEDETDPSSFVGIEIGMNLRVDFSEEVGLPPFRFVGRIDGVHCLIDRDALMVQENKTGSRIDDAWIDSFEMLHQVTGYCLGTALLTGRECTEGRALGMAIPLPRSYDYGGIVFEPFTRTPSHFNKWAEWLLHTYSIYCAYIQRPDDAPRYTHSCNRYFRSCSMIPYCASPDEERAYILDELPERQWDPLAEQEGDD